jgi:hypothetical protein
MRTARLRKKVIIKMEKKIAYGYNGPLRGIKNKKILGCWGCEMEDILNGMNTIGRRLMKMGFISMTKEKANGNSTGTGIMDVRKGHLKME